MSESCFLVLSRSITNILNQIDLQLERGLVLLGMINPPEHLCITTHHDPPRAYATIPLVQADRVSNQINDILIPHPKGGLPTKMRVCLDAKSTRAKGGEGAMLSWIADMVPGAIAPNVISELLAVGHAR